MENPNSSLFKLNLKYEGIRDREVCKNLCFFFFKD